MEMFEVTEEWFNNNRDCIPGLNRMQANALGEKYPLLSGWKKRCVGKLITMEQKKAYEDAKGNTYAVLKQAKKQEKQVKKLKSLTVDVEVARLELEIAEIKSKLNKLKKGG